VQGQAFLRSAVPFSLALIVSVAPLASAQPSIAGTVRDAAGEALPAASIEASSASLIERVRKTSSDAKGEFTIDNLRPGVFTVTVSRQGFTTVIRQGIELSGSAVATVDVDLPVAGRVEVTNVAGVPLLDVRSSGLELPFTREIIDGVPTGRSLANLGILIPGMVSISARNQVDVGGINNLQNIFLSIHGSRVSDQRVLLDGVNLRNLQSEGHAINFTPDMGGSEEVVVLYATRTAGGSLGGVTANYIPRSGGNTFSGTLFATAAGPAFQGSNISSALRASGLAQPDALKRTYDVNPTFGGPLVRDRVWFYTAFRAQSNQNYVGGIFENRNAGNPDAWTYDPDFSRQGVFQITQQSVNTRLTWRWRPRNTFTAFVERQWRVWDEGTVNRAPEAFSRFRFPQNKVAILGWESPVSDHFLIQARGAVHAEVWNNIGGDDLRPNNRALIPVVEQGGAYPGLMYRAKNGAYTGHSAPAIKLATLSATYITGRHQLKMGADWTQGRDTNPNTFNDSGLQYRLNDGVPNQITEFATPYTMVWSMTESGAFLEDAWRLKRLTLTNGLRLDYFGTSFPAQHLGAGPLVPARDITLPATSFYRLKDLSPRLGAAIDLTGDGRTAIKVSAGRYVVALSPATGNPIAGLPLTVTRAWTDRNQDFVADCDLRNPQANAECGAVSDANFGGTSPSVAFDPAIVRGWNVRPNNWLMSASIEREFASRATVTVGYFRRVYGNFTVTDNRATTAADYSPFSVTAPGHPRLPDGGGYSVGGFYDLNPDKLGQVTNYVTSADHYGGQAEHWNGIDLTMKLRWSGALLQGGLSSGRTSADVCAVAAEIPEMLGTPAPMLGARAIPASLDQCRFDTRFVTQLKAVGRYLIPRLDMSVAATVQSLPGPELQANYVAPNAVVQPSLGRPLSGGANATVSLISPGQVYGRRMNQLDVRVARTFRFGEARAVLNLDMYNALNANPVTAVNLVFAGSGDRWLQPQGILPARVFKVSVQLEY